MKLICSCRQTSEALHRSVQTARTAWAFSVAERLGAGGRRGLVGFEVVGEFLVLASIVDSEFEFSFFGPQNDRLSFHAADHVEGSFGLSTQSHLQKIFVDAGLDGFAQLGGDLKIPVRWTQSFDALVRAFVIIIFDPKTDPFPRRLEAVELRAGEKLLPDRFPEPFDFAQGHGMMRPGFEVMSSVLSHLGLETSLAPPVHVLPSVIGQHLFGRLILGGRHPKHFEHVFGSVTAKQVGTDYEPGIVVHKPDNIGVLPAQSEGEDIRLPHLIGRGSFEESRPGQIAPGLGWAFDQAFFFECLADGLAAGG